MKNIMKTLKHVPKAQQQFVMMQLLGAQQCSSRSPPADLSNVIQMCQPSFAKTPASAVEDQAPSNVTSPSTLHATMTLGNSLQRVFVPPKVGDAPTTSSMPAPTIPALMDTAPAAKNRVAAAEAEDADDDPLRDLEQAIGDVVEQRAKTKAAAKQAAKVNKKPAAAEPASTAKSSGACLKRPASALTSIPEVDMEDFFKKLKSVKKGAISYGAYTSRAFDTAKRRATRAGACKEDALAFARSNFAIASRMYYANM